MVIKGIGIMKAFSVLNDLIFVCVLTDFCCREVVVNKFKHVVKVGVEVFDSMLERKHIDGLK